MKLPAPRRLFNALFALCSLFVVVDAAHAAPPSITDVSLRGLQAGTVNRLTIRGSNLLPAPRVMLPIPIAEQTIRDGATDKLLQIDLTLPPESPVGIVQLRLNNPQGISSPVAVSVDTLRQAKFAPELKKLPVALIGNLRGTEILKTTFAGKAGQRIVAEAEAKRLGSALSPVLHLYDERRVQIAWAQGLTTLSGDARLQTVLAKDGNFTLELHDALYRGGNPSYFRLKIGDLAFADLAFPLAAKRGASATVNLIGANVAAGSQAQIQAATIGDFLPATWPAGKVNVNNPPRLLVSDLNEMVEQPAADGALQQMAAPAAINGRLSAAGEEDRYQIAVKPGTRLRFELTANRSGSPLDAVLAIRDADGKELARGDDSADSVDPAVNYAVPRGVRSVVIAVRDLLSRGGPDYIYRVAVTELGRPDFSLALFEDRTQPPQNGAAIVRVRATRAGYRGPIRLDFQGLPEGVAVLNHEIPADATDALVTLIGAGPNPAGIVTRVVGTSVGDTSVRHLALMPANQVTKQQPWLREELAVALTDPASLQVTWVSESAEARLPVGDALISRVAVTRGEKLAGQVRLSLMTSQITPKKTEKVGRVQRQVDDPSRALRLDGTPSIAADQNVGEVKLLVPSDLPLLPYDIAVQADLLSADGKQVLATAVTPARRLLAMPPVQLQLAGEPTVEAKAGAGPTGKLSGKITRVPGFDQPIVLTLIGLPADLPPPVLELASNQTRFELDVAFPYGSKLGDLAKVKLVAARADNSQPLAGTEVPITVKVVPGEASAPVTSPLHKLFEDERQFAALLHEGDGDISLERADRYSGPAALRIAGDQRYRTKMPEWSYKITEHPAEGEFRYLRFAWKKSGGNNILLQLAANGSFGPSRGMPGPAFRYEAGADNSANLAAVKIAKKLPEDWVVVTRDLFADFGAFTLDGISFTPGEGDYALFDQVYLARSESDLQSCPPPVAPEQPLAVFEDEAPFVAQLTEGGGQATLETSVKFSGTASIKVTPDQKFNTALPNLGIKIRQQPGPGEYRFLTFAWKKQGGSLICLQLNHDGQWGPTDGNSATFRYDAGTGDASFGGALRVDRSIPTDFTVITRDLYADFGEFTLTGLALSPQDGDFGLFDHVYLGRSPRDFELVRPATEVASGR